MLLLDNVTFSYPNCCFSALYQVSLTLEDGSFTAILGANGSGKSTLTKLLNAILIPNSGSVQVDGLDSSNPSNVYAIRSKVGVIFQNPDTQIICDTVEDEIAFGLENLGLSVEEMRRRIDFCLKQTGLWSLKDTNPQRLSGGQKQLVCIASVLAMQPKYLVLDEATSMLDPQGRKLVLDFVQNLHKTSKITVLMITHNVEECALASKVVVLAKGRVSFEGDVKELFTSKALYTESSVALPIVTQLSQRLIAKGVSLPQDLITVEDFCQAYTALPKEVDHA